MFLDQFDLPDPQPQRSNRLVSFRCLVNLGGFTQIVFTLPSPRVFKSMSHLFIRVYTIWFDRSVGLLFKVHCHWEDFDLTFDAESWSLQLRNQLTAHYQLTDLESELSTMPRLMGKPSHEVWDFGGAKNAHIFVDYKTSSVDVMLFHPFGNAIPIAQVLSPCSVMTFPSGDHSIGELFQKLQNSNLIPCTSEELIPKLRCLLELVDKAYSRYFLEYS